jgi:hypothetical protein
LLFGKRFRRNPSGRPIASRPGLVGDYNPDLPPNFVKEVAMKKLLFIIVFSCNSAIGADYYWFGNKKEYKDAYGHSYKRSETLDKDSDGDGVSNRFDYDDKNKNVQHDWQVPYKPKKNWFE